MSPETYAETKLLRQRLCVTALTLALDIVGQLGSTEDSARRAGKITADAEGVSAEYDPKTLTKRHPSAHPRRISQRTAIAHDDTLVLWHSKTTRPKITS